MQKKLSFTRFGLVLTTVLLLALLTGIVTPAYAAVFNQEGTIGPNEVIEDDVFLTGDKTVTMDGTVNGMLMASSETVTINGTVNGDAFLFGNHIIVSEKARISGNLFTAASIIDVQGQIGGSIFGGSSSLALGEKAKTDRNMYYGGYSLETKPGSIINRDLFVGAYQALLGGDVARNASIAAGAVELNGKVGQNVRLEVGSPSDQNNPAFPGFLPPGSPAAVKPGLRVAETAKIGGQLIYTSSVDQGAAIKSKPVSGIVLQTPVPDENRIRQQQAQTTSGRALGIVAGVIRDILTLLILGGLALWLLPVVFKRTVEITRGKILPASGYGFVTIIVGYLAAFLAFILIVLVGLIFSAISLGGLSSAVFGVGLSGLGLATVCFTFLVSLGSKLVVTFLVGEWVVGKIAPQANNQKQWSLVSGVAIYAVLHNIPYVGWLVGFIVTIIGVGAFWMLYQNWRVHPQPGSTIPAAAE